MAFSSILKLTDLDDFISPAQDCIKPVQPAKPPPTASKVKIQLEDQTTSSNIDAPKQNVQINLTDCLACSGCVTSAESVLIAQQSPEEILKCLKINQEFQAEGKKSQAVVSLGVQAVLSISNKYSLDPQETAERLSGLFRELGADIIVSTTLAENISLLEARNEFLDRLKNSPESLPIIGGLCPGWVCYAEKLHPHAIPHISKVKSPQQIMGGLIKLIYGPQHGLAPDEIYHISLMACFDRKLESSRKEFELGDYKSREVDVVITPVELEQMFENMGKSLIDFERVPLRDLFGRVELLKRHRGSGSGGFAEFLLRSSSQILLGQELNEESLTWAPGRNPDISTAAIRGDDLELKFSVATGFRNIQTLVRKLKLKTKKDLAHYIELMACPTGCLNGGAQSRPDSSNSRDLASKLEYDYNNLPLEEDFEQVLEAFPILKEDRELYNQILYTDFHAIEKSNNLGIKW